MNRMRLVLCLAGALVLASAATAQVPSVVPFQGVIRDAGGNIIGADTQVQFRIYSAASGGTALWGPETHTVTPQNGIVSVFLGAGSPAVPINAATVFASGDRYLEITVGTTTLSPRIRMGSTPYAMTGGTVVDNAITSAKIADATIATADLADNSVTSAKIVDGSIATADLANNAVTAAKIADEPGVANGRSASQSVTVNNAYTVLAEASITVPAAGYVLAIGACEFEVNKSDASSVWVQSGVSASSSTMPVYQDIGAQLPSGAANGSYLFAASPSGVFQVAAGARTFYFVAWRSSAGEVTAWDSQISLVYFPTAHGAVTSNLASEADPPQFEER